MLVTVETIWDLPESSVMASGSVVKGCQIPFGGDVDLYVSYAVHHRQASLVATLK